MVPIALWVMHSRWGEEIRAYPRWGGGAFPRPKRGWAGGRVSPLSRVRFLLPIILWKCDCRPVPVTGGKCCISPLMVSTAGAAAWLPHAKLRGTGTSVWKWYPLRNVIPLHVGRLSSRSSLLVPLFSFLSSRSYFLAPIFSLLFSRSYFLAPIFSFLFSRSYLLPPIFSLLTGRADCVNRETCSIGVDV